MFWRDDLRMVEDRSFIARLIFEGVNVSNDL